MTYSDIDLDKPIGGIAVNVTLAIVAILLLGMLINVFQHNNINVIEDDSSITFSMTRQADGDALTQMDTEAGISVVPQIHSGSVRLIVSDMLGEVISEQSVNPDSSEFSIPCDEGNYTLSLRADKARGEIICSKI